MSKWLIPLLLVNVLNAKAQTGPMSLEACREHARKHSPELGKLEISLENQRLSTVIKKARFAFGLSASADKKLEEDSTSGSLTLKKEVVGGIELSSTLQASEVDEEDGDSSSLSLKISKIILGGGTLLESRLDVDLSLIDELIALNKINEFRRSLDSRIGQAYYAVIRNLQTLKIRELKLQRSKRNLEHALERENPLDIATAQIEVPETEASVLSARQSIATSLDNLKKLIGMDINQPLSVSSQFDFAPVTLDVTNDTAYCLAHHEDIVNARLERKKAESEARVLKSRTLPTVTLSGTSSQTDDTGHDFSGDEEFTIGLSLAWKLGRNADRATYARKLNDIRSRDLNIRLINLEKEKELRRLSSRLDEARKLVELQEKKVAFSQRKLVLYADRWENGEIGILEYVRSQNDLENSRIQLINYKTNYMELLGEYRALVAR